MQAIKDFLYKQEEIIFAYLYGSLAKKTDNKLSDIDLAIYIDENKKPPSSNFGYRSDLIYDLQKFSKKDIDLIILNEVSITLAFNVIKEGKLLFTKSKRIRTEFHDKTMNKYLDLLPLFKVQKNYLKSSIEEGKYGR